jgi:hypothetical protein
LLDNGQNYLLKMREDVTDFNAMKCCKVFNFSDKGSDPFLLAASLEQKKSIAAGGGLRTLQ